MLIALMLAVAGACLYAATALFNGSWMVTPVLSGSMRPGLPVGGLVICQRVPATSVQLRDVIVFRRPDESSEQMIHRVVSMKVTADGQQAIQTQGDANQSRDPWTLTISDKYVYRARFSIPLLGYVAVASQNHRPMMLLGAGIIVLVVAASSLIQGTRRQRTPQAGVQSDAADTEDAPALLAAGPRLQSRER